VEYEYCHVLLVRKGAVLEGTTEILNGIGRCHGMGTNVGKRNYGDENLKATISNTK
jgi:hypothetical protein